MYISCMYTYVHACIFHACIHTYMHVHFMCVCVYIRTCMYISCMYTYVHACIFYACTHTYMHVYFNCMCIHTPPCHPGKVACRAASRPRHMRSPKCRSPPCTLGSRGSALARDSTWSAILPYTCTCKRICASAHALTRTHARMRACMHVCPKCQESFSQQQDLTR